MSVAGAVGPDRLLFLRRFHIVTAYSISLWTVHMYMYMLVMQFRFRPQL
jgi:hypothetical protein